MNLANNMRRSWNFPLTIAVILDLMVSSGVFSQEHIPIDVREMPPHIHVSGSHYRCGKQIGSQLRDKFQDFVNNYDGLNKVMIPAYNTDEGREVYNRILKGVKSSFPQYVKELRGQAKGAGVPFYKLFLLNIETPFTKETKTVGSKTLSCSDFGVCRPGEVLMGHNEDIDPTLVNHVYLVTAEITNKKRLGKWEKETESFTAFCYVGYLAGYAFGFNEYGLVNSINTIQADTVYGTKTPRMFLCRAALSAESFEDLVRILADESIGAGEALSMNVYFYERWVRPEDVVLHNIEIAPPLSEEGTRSRLNFAEAKMGENLYHFNSFQRMKDTTAWDPSSLSRLKTYKEKGPPKNRKDVLNLLGDKSGKPHKIFKDPSDYDFIGVSVVSVVFDLINNVLSVYSGNPKNPDTPVMDINMEFSLAP